METLRLLGVGLGLATLAGINLYLTVLVCGLAIHFHWITLLPQYQHLEILGHPVVIGVAGFLYFVEFFADKIPWVDSLWDSVHTAIRPLGGAMLAVTALGNPNPVYDVVVALLGGGMSFATHTVKAGVRLIANGSPEPFSNTILSVGEDALVFGGLALISWQPVVALGVVVVIFIVVIWLFPILFRMIRVKVWLAWRKLQQPAQDPVVDQLPDRLPHDYDTLLRRIRPGEPEIAWAVRVISNGGKKLPLNRDGWLAGVRGEPRIVYFLAKKMFGDIALAIDRTDCEVSHEPGFLQDELVICHPAKGWKCGFIFDRPRHPVADALMRELSGNDPVSDAALAEESGATA
jgi:hypothetical protein